MTLEITFFALEQSYDLPTTGIYIGGLAQDCSNSSALAMELLQSCPKPWTCIAVHALEKLFQ